MTNFAKNYEKKIKNSVARMKVRRVFLIMREMLGGELLSSSNVAFVQALTKNPRLDSKLKHFQANLTKGFCFSKKNCCEGG